METPNQESNFALARPFEDVIITAKFVENQARNLINYHDNFVASERSREELRLRFEELERRYQDIIAVARGDKPLNSRAHLAAWAIADDKNLHPDIREIKSLRQSHVDLQKVIATAQENFDRLDQKFKTSEQALISAQTELVRLRGKNKRRRRSRSRKRKR